MNLVKLKEKTKENVTLFWEKTKDQEIQKLFPLEEISLSEALNRFQKKRENHDTSFGRAIYWENRYIGDIWCYAIDTHRKKAFLSILIFEKGCWNKGLGTEVLNNFIPLIAKKYELNHIKAYTYEFNKRAIGCFEKAGFYTEKIFEEDGQTSRLLSRNINIKKS